MRAAGCPGLAGASASLMFLRTCSACIGQTCFLCPCLPSPCRALPSPCHRRFDDKPYVAVTGNNATWVDSASITGGWVGGRVRQRLRPHQQRGPGWAPATSAASTFHLHAKPPVRRRPPPPPPAALHHPPSPRLPCPARRTAAAVPLPPYRCPAGPLYRNWAYQWLPERYSPIFTDSLTELVCPLDAHVTMPFPE